MLISDRDNRVLPSFITEKDGEFARTMFNHPSTACNEQNLNSIIVKPAQGEELDMTEVLKDDTYRIAGYAYDGGGHEVQRVELSLDDGKTWLYCLRQVCCPLTSVHRSNFDSSPTSQFDMVGSFGPGFTGTSMSMQCILCGRIV
jgi:hypothetical protein